MEVDAEVILTLQRQIRELRGQVEQLEYFRDQHMGTDAGQSGFNYPHPNQKVNVVDFAGGIMRLDRNGIQIDSSESADLLPAIIFVRDATAVPSSSFPRSSLEGLVAADSTYSTLSLNGLYSASVAASVTVKSGLTSNNSIEMVLNDGGGTSGYVALLANGSGESYLFLNNKTPLLLDPRAADPATLSNGMIWHRSDTFRPRIRTNGITGNLGIEIQSASAAAVGNNGTITTAGVSEARVAPAGAVTGVILAVGTTGGQMCTVVNESVAASTVTFAASGTSNVADGVASVIAGLTARTFSWDSSTALWYPCK